MDAKETKSEKFVEKGLFGDKIFVPEGAPPKYHCDFLPRGHLGIVITGASGSGKTSLLLNIIPQIKDLTQVIICSKIGTTPVYDAIRSWCATSKPPIEYGQYMGVDDAVDGIAMMMDKKPEGTEGIIIFDDFNDGSFSRSDPYNKCANECSTKFRNLGYHNAFITQNATAVQTLIRTNCNVRATFMMGTPSAVVSVKKDFIGTGLVNSAQFDELYKLINETYHSFLLVMNKGGNDRKLYISIPGRTHGVEEVCFGTALTKDDIETDVNIKRAMDALAKTSTALNRRKILARLKKYIDGLAENSGDDPERLKDVISELYHIDL